MRAVRALIAVAIGAAVWFGGAHVALAKSTRTYSYPIEQVWPAALRFLRVDEGVKITEKDADGGYALFELVDGKKTYAGAMELVRVKDDRGRPATRVVITITDRPPYMEEGMLERLENKLHTQLGDPAPAPKKERDKDTPPDDGAPHEGHDKEK